MQIIKDRRIQEDSWVQLSDDEPVPATGDVIVSLHRYLRERESLLARSGKLGLLLRSDDEPEKVGSESNRFAVIAVEFPKFTDGRGFSTARLLRDRFGFQGELRAVGHVLRDQIFYMHRCGFNAFQIAPGKDIQEALGAFDDFSVTYQAAADDTRPLYRRRVR